ncbi:ribbon-helix-helix protein, CopG family [Pseudofrankia sp. BMG5.37]|uniref:ribbon-helix-helix protein, CopG family n=1 Tax=Pseudofrankia sp. BMG5.37 TaxID=3050035 RepID=UPI000E2A3BCB
MTHRTQITLADDQYARLRAESRRSGLGLAKLVRRAIDHTYGTARPDQQRRTQAPAPVTRIATKAPSSRCGP